MTIFDIKPYSAWKAQWQQSFYLWRHRAGDKPRTVAHIELLQECARRNQALIASLRTTIAQQQDTINEATTLLEQADKRITELERQLAATLTTIEAAAWCGQCNLPADHCRENHDGQLYAKGCAP